MAKRKIRKPKEKPVFEKGRVAGTESPRQAAPSTGGTWLFGFHAVSAALNNPRRTIRRLLATETALEKLSGVDVFIDEGHQPEIVGRADIDTIVGADVVHQGVAALTDPIDDWMIEDLIAETAHLSDAVIVVLDQATDPHNIGAVLRSTAAFGGKAVVLPERHSPTTTGTIAKAAAGALETVPLVHVTNLARALETLKKEGFWCIGLDGYAETSINAHDWSGKTALVLGAEGSGLRRLTKETCDLLVSIPIDGIESLNLSNAAAVTLYEIARRRPS